MASHVQPLNAVTPNLQDPTVLAQMQQWGFTNQSPAWWEDYFNTVNQQSLQQPSIASINTNNLPESFNNLQTAALGALAQNIQQSMGSWMQTMGSRVQAGWQQFNVPLNNFANNTLLAPSTTAPTPYQLSAAVADIDITTLPTVDGKTPAVASADYTQLANTTLEPEANTNTPRQLAGTDPLTIGMNSPAGGYPALAGVSPYGFTVLPTTATVGEDSGIAALLAGAYPPPGSVGGSTGLTPTAMPISNPLIYAPTASAYTGGAYIPPQFADSSSSLQQMMNQNLALTSEGTALNLYLQQVQQVAQAQQRPTGPIYAAPQFTQPTPIIMSAAPISSAVGNNGSSSGTLPMQSTSSDKRSKKYEQVLQGLKLNLSTKQQASLKQFQQVFEQNKSKYEAVAKRLGVPQELVPLAAKAIWALHCREGSCDFSTYLHNGEKLGKRTTLVPAGVLFDNWEDAAVDAIKRKLPKVSGGLPKSVPEWLAFAEVFNGTGYEQKGTASPYVLAGTNAYKKGKYVADGKYDPNHVDQQLGVAALITA
jgi:lysozyme family protein